MDHLASEGGAIAFLVYDSRSGSTVLSRKLVEMVAGVCVTPELAFDSILHGNRTFRRHSTIEMVRTLIRTRGIRNLSPRVRRALIRVARSATGSDAATVINLAVNIWRNEMHEAVHSECIVVKGGTHVRYWREIHRAYRGSARFIYLIRDPRAVIDSKLRTRRPYVPSETMAWGGALLAAIRWRQFAKTMRTARLRGEQVLEIKYEDFIASPAEVMAKIADFLGVALSNLPTRAVYKIPKAEQQIHLLALSGKINEDRVNRWQMQLSDADRRVIEAVCYTEMRARGYEPIESAQAIRRYLRSLRGVPGALSQMLSHFRRVGFGSRQPVLANAKSGRHRRRTRTTSTDFGS